MPLLSTEQLLKINIPIRAQHIRVLFSEIGRILNHMINVPAQAMDVGALTPTLWGWEEREKLFDEHRTKMIFRDNLLISSNILYHYLSGNSSEVVVMNEWNNIMDADKSIKTTAERRKKGWPNKKTREEFQKRFNKYWVGGHSDMGNYELNKKNA